jgi:hypothetical protein
MAAPPLAAPEPGTALAGVINLDGPGHYLSWGWLQISWANATVIVLMILVFVLALVLPFPGARTNGRRR